MEHYTAEVEVARRDDLGDDETDRVMDELADFAPAIATTARGYQTARITFPADTLSQAARVAIAAVSMAYKSEVIRLDVMTEAEADRREAELPIPELLSAPEAAAMLGVTQQRVRQMIGEGKLAARRIGDRSFALVKAEVEAKVRAAH